MKPTGNRSSLYCRHELSYPGPCAQAARRRRSPAVSAVAPGGGRRLLEREHRTVVVVGGGQAGLPMSWCLRQRGVDHVALAGHRGGCEGRGGGRRVLLLAPPPPARPLPRV